MLEESGVQAQEWEKNHIQLPIAHFWTDGPDGRHLCYIMPVLGPTSKQNSGGTSTIRDLLHQVGIGLQFLHQRKIGHGDLRPDNILLRLEDISKIGKEEMKAKLGAPVA